MLFNKKDVIDIKKLKYFFLIIMTGNYFYFLIDPKL